MIIFQKMYGAYFFFILFLIAGLLQNMNAHRFHLQASQANSPSYSQQTKKMPPSEKNDQRCAPEKYSWFQQYFCWTEYIALFITFVFLFAFGLMVFILDLVSFFVLGLSARYLPWAAAKMSALEQFYHALCSYTGG